MRLRASWALRAWFYKTAWREALFVHVCGVLDDGDVHGDGDDDDAGVGR